MVLILLKSSACLLAFIAFYKVVLERTSSHRFKRFYLLAVVLLSIGIPFITFIEYIEPRFLIGDFGTSINNPIEASLPPKEEINYIPFLLWCLYAIGLALCSIRFVLNLTQLFFKIKRSPKQKTSQFINVLLEDFVVPHTFFNYIFFNKTKFENKEIPKEVILHEETHAKQKHSIDILFIEFLQIVFWFNPLVYILKRDIKLNHEFLADEAVINEGTPLTNYQQLLIEFSSNSSTNHLANAINYSLIKKRFTVMKTKTSKQSLWLRSLLILPLLATLIYGFSATKHIEREVIPKMTMTSKNHQTEISDIKIQQNIPTINGIPCDNCTVNLSKDGVAKLVLGTTTSQDVLAFKIKFLGKPSHTILGNKGLTKGALTQLAQVSYGQNIQIFEIKTREKEKLGPIGINIVSKDDKNYSHSPKVVKGERSIVPPPPAPKVVKGELSNIPPPPPPIPTNATKAQRLKYEKIHAEYNKKYSVKNGEVSEKLPPPPPVPKNASPEEKTKYNKVIEKYKANQKELDLRKRELIEQEKKVIEGNLAVKEQQIKIEEIKNIPPPPPVPEGATLEQKKEYEVTRVKYEESRHERMKELESKRIMKTELHSKDLELAMKEWELRIADRESTIQKRQLEIAHSKTARLPKSPLDHVTEMAKKEAVFYYEGKKVTSDKAISLLKENKKLNISSSSNDGISTVKLSKNGIKN